MLKTEEKRIVENNFIRFWIEDGIMYSAFKEPTVVNLDVARKIVELRHEISQGEKQRWCFDFTLLKEYKKEARDYAAIHGQEYLYGTAVIINSHIERFILNTFMRLKSSKIPLQAFRTREDAAKWLNSIGK